MLMWARGSLSRHSIMVAVKPGADWVCRVLPMNMYKLEYSMTLRTHIPRTEAESVLLHTLKTLPFSGIVEVTVATIWPFWIF